VHGAGEHERCGKGRARGQRRGEAEQACHRACEPGKKPDNGPGERPGPGSARAARLRRFRIDLNGQPGKKAKRHRDVDGLDWAGVGFVHGSGLSGLSLPRHRR
jgi:hypothetical protein